LPPEPRHPPAVTAIVALGSNLDDPPSQIRRALQELARLPQTRLLRRSSLYRNPPEGGAAQPEYVNAVAMVETALAPRALLAELLAIERAHGRVRAFPGAPRTLDLDLVLYGDLVLEEPGLVIPHPRMRERAFVLVPLAEIAPGAVVPGAGPVAELLGRVDASGLVKLDERTTRDGPGSTHGS
jgi:2-amino-4-hydroxy-6-hydroxymethyldihydropteridine diphosphokinase